jgi:hypothetical protein
MSQRPSALVGIVDELPALAFDLEVGRRFYVFEAERRQNEMKAQAILIGNEFARVVTLALGGKVEDTADLFTEVV